MLCRNLLSCYQLLLLFIAKPQILNRLQSTRAETINSSRPGFRKFEINEILGHNIVGNRLYWYHIFLPQKLLRHTKEVLEAGCMFQCKLNTRRNFFFSTRNRSSQRNASLRDAPFPRCEIDSKDHTTFCRSIRKRFARWTSCINRNCLFI